MSSRLVSVVRQALKTFERPNKAFATNMELLKQLTEQLCFQDFHFSQEDLLSDEAFDREKRSPCCYVNIFENDAVSMGVFVLRSGFTIPLHDHPVMHGVLRSIYGQLNVQSYTKQVQSDDDAPLYDRSQLEIPVIAEEPRIISPRTECSTFTPTERNFHEISAVEGVAAFFDILSPPYDADIPVYGSRLCRFYRLESKEMPIEGTDTDADHLQPPSKRLQLVRIPVPRWYICDNVNPPEEIKSLESYVC